MNCPNHPERETVSFCHACGDHLCRTCLTEGAEYYYCKKAACQEARLQELERKGLTLADVAEAPEEEISGAVNGLTPDSAGAIGPIPSLPLNRPVEYAGFWKRFAATLIDYLIIFVPTFIITFSLMVFGGLDGESKRQQSELIVQGISIVINWLYFAFMESSPLQATVGKRALGLIVTDVDGRPLTFARATGRYFGKLLSGLTLCIGYIMAGFTQRKQALHDIIAGCLVIKK